MLTLDKTNSSAKNIFLHIGHVNNVINGIVPEHLKTRRFLAEEFKYGFETASTNGLSAIGESILVNKTMYVNRTDSLRKDKDALAYGEDFMSTGMFLIPNDATANFKGILSTEESKHLESLYEELFERAKKPIAVVGCAKLSKCRSTYITRPPIFGEQIFQKKYFEDGENLEENLSIMFVAVISNFNDHSLSELNSKLSSVLYNNPSAKDSLLISHTHALVLNGRERYPMNTINAGIAKKVVHLYSDSMVSEAELEVYIMDDIKEIK